MITFLAALHVLIAVTLVLLVLLQDSKGGAMGVFGGGSSNSLWGSTGATNFLVKATRWVAFAFAISCLNLAFQSTRRNNSVLDGAALPSAPPAQQAPATPGAPAEQPAAPTEAAPQTK